ncbi:MAG TPA: type III-B CRISPR module RAMP protein Cmr1 [Candidatus Paceibacterota bacterium]|nr:type III-B CRISPR module RAMP protein Cmr1 [Verrucomicrobiota bacterium]HRZ43562.1 type III-B CRISPR module RAMP protein Cmr1 [Candidatus Paceibacterota bacterium]
MKTATFDLDIISPCFCGGAQPKKTAEIRAPSIRGQLRWWFRTLGGFKSLAPRPVSKQEAIIFGSTAGDNGRAGKLTVRVRTNQTVSGVRDSQELEYPMFSGPAYLTFPIQSREKDGHKSQYNGRGVVISGSFQLCVTWRGSLSLWHDIHALIGVFVHIGSLGYRGRRAMGGLAFNGQPPVNLPNALSHFSSPNAILIKKLDAKSSQDAINVLGSWLKSCRSHGRSGQNDLEKQGPYFRFAENDHDIGYQTPSARNASAFRPALGLPIIQRIRNATNNWDWNWNRGEKKGIGRFASPVILRPYRDEQNQWHALVIFVDAHQWPTGKEVYVNGQPRKVSLELYEAMKHDSRLGNFL